MMTIWYNHEVSNVKGKHKKYFNPTRRLVQAERGIFEIIDMIGWDYSEVFEEGYRTLIDRYVQKREGTETPIGLFRLSHFDLILTDLKEKIDEYTKLHEVLSTMYQLQLSTTHVPEGKRELSNMFRDLADRTLPIDDLPGYFSAAKARVSSGKSLTPIVTSILDEIKKADGENAIVGELEQCEDRAFRENLIWDYLKGKCGEANG